MAALARDVRLAWRGLRRTPLFLAGIILTLAIGVGANGAVFSILHAVLLQPLPVCRNPDGGVMVWNTGAQPTNWRRGTTAQRIVAWHDESKDVFEDLAAFVKLWAGNLKSPQIDLITQAGAERLRGGLVTPNFFTTLGVTAVAGRVFTADDEAAGVKDLAVLSHGLWQRAFAGDAGVVGRSVTFITGRAQRGPRPLTIVGVLPADVPVHLPARHRTVGPAAVDPDPERAQYRACHHPQRGSRETATGGHVRAGTEPGDLRSASARRSLATGRAAFDDAPRARVGLDHRRDTAVTAVPGRRRVAAPPHYLRDRRDGVVHPAGGESPRSLGARGTRGEPIAAREARAHGRRAARRAGIGRRHAAFAALHPALRAIVPPIVPRADEIGLSIPVVVFALAITGVTVFLSVLAPAWRAGRTDVSATLGRGAGVSSPNRTSARWQSGLLAIESGVAAALLVSAGLLLTSFWRLNRVHLGFDGDNVLTVEMRLLDMRYRPPAALAAFQRDLIDRVRAVPWSD